MQYKKEVMPEINVLCPDSGSGVSLSLIESVKCHFQRLITLLHLQPGRYSMTAKEGLDGSGRHAVYDQLGNVQTHNIIIWMWVPLHLSKNSDQHQHACTSKSTESEIVWKEGAPSSPKAARPILITLGKKGKELLEKIVPPVDEEISKLHSSGLMVEVSGEVFIFEVEFICSMNNGKMQKLLLGRGGAFCILCPHTQEEAISLQQIKDSFEMGEVEIDELYLLYDDLVDEDGNVVKRRDYGERLGLTQCPITGVSIKTFPILHALLRGFDFCLKVLYKLNAGVTSWKDGKILAGRVNEAKKRVREIIKSKTGIAVDQPDRVWSGGTTTTRNTAPKFLFEAEK